MAEFQFKCPQCGADVLAEDELRGQVLSCPYCKKGIVVPNKIEHVNCTRVPIQCTSEVCHDDKLNGGASERHKRKTDKVFTKSGTSDSFDESRSSTGKCSSSRFSKLFNQINPFTVLREEKHVFILPILSKAIYRILNAVICIVSMALMLTSPILCGRFLFFIPLIFCIVIVGACLLLVINRICYELVILAFCLYDEVRHFNNAD